MKSRVILAILLVAAFLPFTPGFDATPAAGTAIAPSYTVTNLDGSAGYPNPTAINADGWVVGYSGSSGYPFVWVPVRANEPEGTLRTLELEPGTNCPPPYRTCFAFGIDEGGRVAGIVQGISTPPTPGYGFVWTPTVPGGSAGTMQKFADGSTATGLNNAIQVIGTTFLPSENRNVATLWQSGEPVLLGALDAAAFLSLPNAINATGQVVGRSSISVSPGPQHAFLWTPNTLNGTRGSMADLGTLGGPTCLNCYSEAYAVNDAGQVVGVSNVTDAPIDTGHAFLWSASTGMTNLGTLPGGWGTVARGINNAGQVVGTAVAGGKERAWIWEHGVMTDLNSLNLSEPGWELVDARAINDAGQIVGEGTVNGETRAFLLTPRTPTITDLSSHWTKVGGSTFTLTVTGSNFVPGAAVRWGGFPLPTTYVSETQLAAKVDYSFIAVAGRTAITVQNPAPGERISNARIFAYTADFKQNDPAWKSDSLGTCGTMGQIGCAVSSVADVFSSYGMSLPEPGSWPINPATLNNYLKEHGGFADACGNFDWEATANLFSLGEVYIDKPDLATRRTLIDTALDSGNLPIVQVHHPSQSGYHFFVIANKVPIAGGSNDYVIVDPLSDKSGQLLSATYGGLGSVTEVVIYDKPVPNPPPASGWSMRVGASAQLLVTDPSGKQTGFLPGAAAGGVAAMATGDTYVQNIPNSAYVFEGGIADATGVQPPLPDSWYYQQHSPALGTYTVQVIGVASGVYTVEIRSVTAAGTATRQTMSGTTAPGSVDRAIVQLGPGPATVTYPLSLATSGTGSGTVAAIPTGPTYAPGTIVTLTATPTAGNSFAGWTVDGSPAGTATPHQLPMNADHTVVAAFMPIPLPSPSPLPGGTLTVNHVGGGTVSTAPAAPYAAGQRVTLTATPDPGQIFLGWTIDGEDRGWVASLAVTMDADHTALATFAPRPTFGDMPASDPAYDAIANLAARGVINGCDKDAQPLPLFCPDAPTLRHQMAALIVRAMPGWADETGQPSFSDNTEDIELMTRVATVQRHGVAQGYQPEVCAALGKTAPCYGPLDTVKYGQVLLFIARAMVEKGYWTLQPDDRAIFPDQVGAPGVDPATDRQTLDHRMVVTYVHYAGAPPDVDAGPDVAFMVNGVPRGRWGDAAPRAWFARALWQALDAYFGR